MDNIPVPQGRIRRTMPLAGFTARAAGGRMVAALREKAGDTDAVAHFHEKTAERYAELLGHSKGVLMKAGQILSMVDTSNVCLLYTSDAADDLLCVDLGGRRIIKKKNEN